MKLLEEKIMSMECLAPSIYRMRIVSEYVAQSACAGQFVSLKCGEGAYPLLRRPISICSVDRLSNTFDLVFQVRGEGTDRLSRMRGGDTVDMIAPIGRGFNLSPNYQNIAVVGGGIGIYPLLALLEDSPAHQKTAFLGFRGKAHAVLLDAFEAHAQVHITTDDGSLGVQGFVGMALEHVLADTAYDMIYACGPLPMLRGVAELAKRKGIACQVSMEERMGCGIGACLGCACKTRLGKDWEYSHVCVDGPVFMADEVVWEVSG